MTSVSVIVPVFERTDRTLKALLSIAEQDYLDYEVFVVDDGSDPPLLKVKDFCHQQGENWNYLRQENQGPGVARNFAARSAKGRWLAFLDSDDHWLPHKLSDQVKRLTESSYRIAQSREIWYRNDKRVEMAKRHQMLEGEIFEPSLASVRVSSSSVILERTLFWEMGGFLPQLFVCEDYHFWLKVSARNPIGLVEREGVVKFGGHVDQLSRRYVSMDRYRVYALFALLLDESMQWEPRERELIVETTLKKLSILEKGANKRGLTEEAQDYRQAGLELDERALARALRWIENPKKRAPQ